MKLYKLLFLIPVFLFASCDLDREPYGTSNFWNTEADVQLGLDAAYAPFYEEEGFGRGHWWVGAASDDMVINRSKGDDEALTEFRTTTNASGGQFDNWKLMYKVIRRTNDVMKHAPLVEMSDKSRDVMLGEANFVCAFAYFHLAKRYGGLPFYDWQHPEEINKPRETKTETYKRIEAYLKESIKHFENQSLWTRDKDATGRPNLGAAYGLLAKVYAHWGKYTEAKAMAEKVINSGKYSLDKTNNNGFAHLFSPAGEKHEEVLFNLTNAPVRNQGTVTSVILLSGTLSGGTGWYYFAPTKSLFNAFAPNDTRRLVTLKGAGDDVHFLGKTTTLTNDMIKDMTTGYMGTKYSAAYNDLSGWNWESGADVPLLRYADVLLIHAEAEIFLAGGGASNRTLGVPAAAASFNEVRVRAFGGDVTKAIAAPTFNDLVNERRCELAYEDERHYDLVRWGLAKEVYAAATVATDPRGPRTFDPTKDAHFPIPQREIENTDYLLVNNPADGYSNFK
ncbi:RagB/SusD family nutrient uptake outer membrane protein [Dysgonomonas sp. Marseille-P4677]|uniref:RagB/SusD family nutrient uptake outer membrane protein n=1 Tax=Dysgonomonas sp. Marseille-P4677 TaxID=2364790 RepID=UPI001912A6FA|nr:RagB/SusD family nutrient uptake outer membrane protein [Dysgonomonas sp. Marseille-P4677]MBK5721207.1 RagB/SusD family nutrient uptake outer membrane protein [Dysgonomonas sp. Marseille-P4677]